MPGTRNELDPRAVPFSTDATALFWEFVDAVEKEMALGGEYESIRPFAAKLPEHAARLAMTIAGYRDPNIAELDHEDLNRGIRLAAYYASEAKRIPNMAGPTRIFAWPRSCSIGSSAIGANPPSPREISIAMGPTPSGTGKLP